MSNPQTIQPSELNTFNTEFAEAMGELYTTDCTAETIEIDERPIPGSLNLQLSEVEQVAGGWNSDVKGVFSTLKKFFVTGAWPRPLKSELRCSVNGVVQIFQVKQLLGAHDRRAQLLIGIGSFGNTK